MALSVSWQVDVYDRLRNSLNKYIYQMAEVFQTSEDKAFPHLLNLVQKSAEKDITFKRDEIVDLAAQVAEYLENRFGLAKDDPSLLAQLKAQSQDFSTQVMASVAATAVTNYYGPEGLLILPAAQLATVLADTIRKWWRKKEKKGLLPQPQPDGPQLLPNDCQEIDYDPEPAIDATEDAHEIVDED